MPMEIPNMIFFFSSLKNLISYPAKKKFYVNNAKVDVSKLKFSFAETLKCKIYTRTCTVNVGERGKH